MDRILRSWDLLRQSFAILISDMELLWLPIYSGIATGAASLLLFSGGLLVFLPQVQTFLDNRFNHPRLTADPAMWAWIFLFYVVNYFIVVFFNVALVATAGDRLAGGRSTVNDGLRLAWQRKGKILQWAILAATVGLVLRALERRMGRLMRITAGIIGIAWTLACYFVVPVLAIENLGPVEALSRSAELFRQTWGEELTGGFSFGLIFMPFGLPAVVLVIFCRNLGQAAMLGALVLAVIYWLLLSVVSSAVHGIFVAALYHYARTKQAAGGFSLDDLSTAWRPRSA
jgi:hypothetical protein